MNTLSTSHNNGRATPTFLLRPLAAACALLVASTVAKAQTSPVAPAPVAPVAAGADAAPSDVNRIVITGIRRSIEDSVSIKRNADTIVEAVSAEELGKLPDASIAEALARLPGVTGQRGPDGRVNVISIRGLSPEFSGALLNGREVVSSGDSRAVEYDQFPSELIGSAVVYKTPDATLIGQGLSGTVDLRARRPLDTRGREVAVNLRGEKNSNGNLVSGVANPIGSRFSISYVDQFANNTLGVAVGFARLDTATQVKQTQIASYGDFIGCCGAPISGVPNQLTPANGGTKAQLPMFWDSTTTTKKNTRNGLMGVFEYKPSKELHSQVDLYYSKFDTHEVGGIFREQLFNAWGEAGGINVSNVGTTQMGKNTYAISGTADKVNFAVGNTDTKRNDSIAALGWNTELKLANKWVLTSDLSYSRDRRDEMYQEVYAAPYDKVNHGFVHSAFSWNVPVDGSAQSWTPLQKDLLNTVQLGDPQGYVPIPGWTGTIRTRPVKDELKALRLSGRRELDGFFSNVTAGINLTERDKVVTTGETRLFLKPDGNGDFNRDVPAGALGTPFNLSWVGLPDVARISVPALVSLGAVSALPLFSQKVANDSGVHEKVITAYGKLDIDTEVAGFPIRGNLGLQAVNTKQNSEGFEYRGSDTAPDINLLFSRTGGATYNNYLPSLNLIADLRNNLIMRFGAAKTMARPNIVDMNAGTSTPTIITTAGPDQGKWTTAYGGNPEIKPWLANSLDLSLEKYFGKRSYVSMAVFHKALLNYIFNQEVARDNSFLPLPSGLPAGIVVQKLGAFVQPSNGHGGSLRGLELSAALEGGLISPMLDSFGILASGSKLGSNIKDKDGKQIELNGLSGTSAAVTFYYEAHGISARISERYRAPFSSTVTNIYLQNTVRQQQADRVVDLQLGYAFPDTGMYKGLSILFQVNNLLDKETQNMSSDGQAPDPTQLRANFTNRFGRQVLLGMNYKF